MIIRAITKSNKKVLDKFTVYFWDGSCLTLSHNPNSPQGVSMWGEIFNLEDSDFKTGEVCGDKMINFFELPSKLQSHIEKRIANAEEK